MGDSRDQLVSLLTAMAKQFGGSELNGDLVGQDTTGSTPWERQCFLSGRFMAATELQMKEYDVPVPRMSDPETNDFVITNRHTKRRYRITVEELEG